MMCCIVLKRRARTRQLREEFLRNSGDIWELQRFRHRNYRGFWLRGTLMYPYTEEVLAILNLEASLRMSSQREIRLKKQAQTESQKKELEETMASSWEQQRRYWWWKDRMLSSSAFLQRGFETWRSNERWYMHQVLVEDCVFRGGCCARGCGCCESPERLTSSVGKLAIGHCSIECACCVETRSGAIPSQEVCKDVDDLYGFSNLTKDFDLEKNVYRFQIYLATIWGLGKGNSSRLPNDIKFNFCDLSVPTSEPACMQDDSSEFQITSTSTSTFLEISDDEGSRVSFV